MTRIMQNFYLASLWLDGIAPATNVSQFLHCRGILTISNELLIVVQHIPALKQERAASKAINDDEIRRNLRSLISHYDNIFFLLFN